MEKPFTRDYLYEKDWCSLIRHSHCRDTMCLDRTCLWQNILHSFNYCLDFFYFLPFIYFYNTNRSRQLLCTTLCISSTRLSRNYLVPSTSSRDQYSATSRGLGNTALALQTILERSRSIY